MMSNRPPRTVLMYRWKVDGPLVRPNRSTFHLNEPYRVRKVCRGKGRVLYVVEGKDALFYERCVGSPDLIAKVGLPSPFYIIG